MFNYIYIYQDIYTFTIHDIIDLDAHVHVTGQIVHGAM